MSADGVYGVPGACHELAISENKLSDDEFEDAGEAPEANPDEGADAEHVSGEPSRFLSVRPRDLLHFAHDIAVERLESPPFPRTSKRRRGGWSGFVFAHFLSQSCAPMTSLRLGRCSGDMHGYTSESGAKVSGLGTVRGRKCFHEIGPERRSVPGRTWGYVRLLGDRFDLVLDFADGGFVFDDFTDGVAKEGASERGFIADDVLVGVGFDAGDNTEREFDCALSIGNCDE